MRLVARLIFLVPWALGMWLAVFNVVVLFKKPGGRHVSGVPFVSTFFAAVGAGLGAAVDLWSSRWGWTLFAAVAITDLPYLGALLRVLYLAFRRR